MGNTGAPPGFGDPASIAAVANGSLQAATTLDELVAQIEVDIRTLTGVWSGDAAEAWQRRSEEIAKEIGRFGDAAKAYQVRIAQAAETMQLARTTLEEARAFAAANHLIIRPDLRVVPLQPWIPARRAQAMICQRRVDAARQFAVRSRREIDTANRIANARVQRNLEEVGTILEALLDRGGGPRVGMRPQPGQRPGAPPETPAGKAARKLRNEVDSLYPRIDDLNRPDLMDRLHAIDPADPDAFRKAALLRRDIESAEVFAGQSPTRYDGGLNDRPTPGGPVPQHFDSGNFVHKYADEVRHLVAPDMSKLPPEYSALIANKRIISIEDLPPGLQAEVRLGETARVDRLSNGTGMIYEIKSASPGEIEKGLRQLEGYERLANQQKFGGIGTWGGAVVVYDPDKVMDFVRHPQLAPK